MLALAEQLRRHAPPGSTLVVEADGRFDFSLLIGDDGVAWDVRAYPPAVIGIWRMAEP